MGYEKRILLLIGLTILALTMGCVDSIYEVDDLNATGNGNYKYIGTDINSVEFGGIYADINGTISAQKYCLPDGNCFDSMADINGGGGTSGSGIDTNTQTVGWTDATGKWLIDLNMGNKSIYNVFDVNTKNLIVEGKGYTVDSIGTPQNVAGVINYGSGNYTAEGYSWVVNVYAYKTVNGVKIFSATPGTVTVIDDSSFNNMNIDWSWDAVVGAEGYRVQSTITNIYQDVAGTSVNDDGTYGFYPQTGSSWIYAPIPPITPSQRQANEISLTGDIITNSDLITLNANADINIIADNRLFVDTERVDFKSYVNIYDPISGGYRYTLPSGSTPTTNQFLRAEDTLGNLGWANMPIEEVGLDSLRSTLASEGNLGTANLNLGYNAGSRQVGGYNVWLGYSAGTVFSSGDPTNAGSHNIGIGGYNQNGDETDTGGSEDNISIGYYAGNALKDSSRNTLVGVYAGKLLDGNNNVFIGFKSGSNRTSDSNILIIHNQDTGSAANDLTNSLIYGKFNSNPANQQLTINANTYMNGDVNIVGVLYGGSPIKVGDDLNMRGNSVFNANDVNAVRVCISGDCRTSFPTSGGSFDANLVKFVYDDLNVVAVDGNARIVYASDGSTPAIVYNTAGGVSLANASPTMAGILQVGTRSGDSMTGLLTRNILIGQDTGVNGNTYLDDIALGAFSASNGLDHFGALAIGPYSITEANHLIGPVAIGANSAQGIEEAIYLISIGGSASQYNKGSNYAVHIGYSAGSSNTDAKKENSILIGKQAGQNDNNQPDVIFIGPYAGMNDNVDTLKKGGVTSVGITEFGVYDTLYVGVGYQVGDIVGLVGGNNDATARITSLVEDEPYYPYGFEVVNPGTGYTPSGFVETTGGSGTGLYVSIDTNEAEATAGTSIAIGKYAGTGGYKDSIAIGRGVINSAVEQANIGNILYLTGIHKVDTQEATPITDGAVQFGSSIYDTTGLGTSGALSIDPNDRTLYGTDGTTPIFEWDNGYLYDPSGVPRIETGGYIYDNTGTLFLKFGDDRGFWYDGMNQMMNLNAGQGQILSYPDNFVSIDFQNRYLVDLAQVNSVNWDSRILYASDGTTPTIRWNDLNLEGNWLRNGNEICDASGNCGTYGGEDLNTTMGLGNVTYFDLNVVGKNIYTDKNLYVVGNIGINTFTPKNKLNVIGDINATTNIYGGNMYLPDNGKHYWGTGNDFSAYYDGTNGYLNAREVGTGQLKVLSDLNVVGYNLITDKNLYVSQNVGIGINPTAFFHMKAGTTSTAPIKFTSGTSLTTSEAGTVEFTTDNLYFTTTSGAGTTVTNRFPVANNSTYVKATSELIIGGYPDYWASWRATNTANSLTGSWNQTNWLSNSTTTNQRVHIDVGTPYIVNRIYYENSHNSGSETDTGAKNFTLWGSNDASAFSNTTYGSDTGWTQLTISASQFSQHTNSNVADPQYITVTSTTPYRYYAIKIADNWGDGTYLGLRRIVLQDTALTGRRQFAITEYESGLTTGRIPYTTTNGRLLDSANMGYNGTDLNMNVLLTNNNKSRFVADVNFDGNVWFNDTYWDDISMNLATSGKPGAKSPVFDEATYAYYFEDQALALNEEYVFSSSEMPHGWKLGTDIECHIHAHPSTTNVGDYNFELCYKWTNINAIEAASATCLTLKQTTDGNASKMFYTEFPAISGSGKTLSSTLEFRLKRLSSGASDTFTGNVYVDSMGCHYQMSQIGSREELVN